MGDISHRLTTANGQRATAAYDLLTVVTHELGHVLGYDDLDLVRYPEHIMARMLQPGVSRIALPTDGVVWSGTVGESDHHVAAQVRDAVSPNLGSIELSVVDRALNDLLDDAPRATDRGWTDSDDDYERLLSNRSDARYEELDAFFALL